jgi:hypothetical protein
MKEEVAHIKGTTRVHKVTEGKVDLGIGAEGKRDMWQPVVNSDGHRG